MYFSRHSLLRYRERMVGSLCSIEEQLEDALSMHCYSTIPPEWYLYWPLKPANVLRWIEFKDADGIDSAALVDVDTADVVTLVKRNV